MQGNLPQHLHMSTTQLGIPMCKDRLCNIPWLMMWASNLHHHHCWTTVRRWSLDWGDQLQRWQKIPRGRARLLPSPPSSSSTPSSLSVVVTLFCCEELSNHRALLIDRFEGGAGSHLLQIRSWFSFVLSFWRNINIVWT